MVFSSIIFIFLFLPIVLLSFLVLNRKMQIPFLFLASLVFYYWGENIRIILIISSTLINYFSALLIGGGTWGQEIKFCDPVNDPDRKYKKTVLVISVILNLGMLVYFKYFNFLVDASDRFLLFLSGGRFSLPEFRNVALPLGISFYTFQAMSYTIDVYRGQVKATRNYIKFAAYVTMFPQLVAGPIVRYKDIEDQLENHYTSTNRFFYGIKRFISGLGKKVIIANTMALVADSVFALDSMYLSFPLAWAGILCYALQIFFDFSGYSDMAIGIGEMLGFTFLENFNYPYISKSIQEFWRRWHISLSTWFRDYLYIPLGGNRKSRLKTYLNLLTVFVLCGFWHGAAWNFLVWGMYHGCFLILERTKFKKLIEKLPKALQHIYTLLVVMIGWVFFRAESLSDAFRYLAAMFGKPAQYSVHSLLEYFNGMNIIIFLYSIVICTPIFRSFMISRDVAFENYKTLKQKTGYFALNIGLLLVLFYCILTLSTGSYNPFIYFRF